jgi:hypothetical protein
MRVLRLLPVLLLSGLPAAAAPVTFISTFANPATYGFDDGPAIALWRTEIDPRPLDPATFSVGGVGVTVTAQGGGLSADGTFPFFRTDSSQVTAIFDFGPRPRPDNDTGIEGEWGPERGGFLWNPDDGAVLRLAFAEPVAQVAGFVNTRLQGSPQSTLTFIARDAGGAELERFTLGSLPFGPGEITDAGGFRGFSRSTLDISVFELRGAFFALDDLTIGTLGLGGPVTDGPDTPEVIPLPAGLPLILCAFGVLALVRRRT